MKPQSLLHNWHESFLPFAASLERSVCQERGGCSCTTKWTNAGEDKSWRSSEKRRARSDPENEAKISGKKLSFPSTAALPTAQQVSRSSSSSSSSSSSFEFLRRYLAEGISFRIMSVLWPEHSLLGWKVRNISHVRLKPYSRHCMLMLDLQLGLVDKDIIKQISNGVSKMCTKLSVA